MKQHSTFARRTARNGARVLAAVVFAFGVWGAPPAYAEQTKTSASNPAEQPLPGLDAVLDDLRKGGLVIFFRHGATEQRGPAEDAADLNNCSTQRNLSADGRAQMTEIGQAFRALSIPIHNVTTSPYCRCKGSSAAIAEPRSDRDRGDRGPVRGPSCARRYRLARCWDVARRLRNRLLVAQLPDALPDQLHQARSRIRRSHRQGQGERKASRNF